MEYYKSKFSGKEVDEKLGKVDELDSAIIYLQNNKIEKENDDYYPNMSVGLADNLAGNDVVDGTFSFRRSGGGAISDGVARVQNIKGNSIVVNGGIVNMSANSLKSVGRNTFDGKWEEGTISGTNGEDFIDATCIRTDFIKVIPNQDYYISIQGKERLYIRARLFDVNKNYIGYAQANGADIYTNEIFTIPSNAHYIRFAPSKDYVSETDLVCLNISDVEFNGQYEPYIEREQELSVISSVFPNGMRSANAAYDEIRYNKAKQKWEKVTRIAEIDMGSISYQYSQITTVDSEDYYVFYFFDLQDIMKKPIYKEVGNILNAKYPCITSIALADRMMPDKTFMAFHTGAIYIRDDSFSHGDDLRAALQGVKLYYELDTPIIEELDDNFNLDYEVWNGGTEVVLSDTPSAPLSAEIAYGVNVVGKLIELAERIDNIEEDGSSVFVAEYGVTTYAEIKEAYEAKKVVICYYDKLAFRLSFFDSNGAYFTAHYEPITYEASCSASNKWTYKPYNAGHSLENLENGNVKVTIANQSAEVATPQYVDEKVAQGGGGGSSSDKQGVVSQILTYNPADNTYSVSNAVRGAIPSFFIDLVTEAGASFNAESGYFSLNGIDNIAYDEMRKIYNCRTGYGTNSLLAVYSNTYTARTNFAAFRDYGSSYSNHEPTTIYTKYLGYRNASITKFALCDEVALYVRVGSANNFDSFGSGAGVEYRSRIEEIIGVLDVTNLTGSNNFFYNGAYHAWLTSFKLKALKASIDLSGMPRLSEATILYMINNEKAASAITIKLHADAKAMADASQAIQSALASHTNIILGV